MDAPVPELDPRFSSPGSTPTPWSAAWEQLETAKTYWLSTVRPDRRPHVTTIAGVWLDGAIHFVTGPSERKAKNLAAGNSRVVVTTGCNGWDGLDIVVEGEAIPVTDADRLQRLVEAFARKYDDVFGYRVQDGRLQAAGAADGPLAFEVRATTAFGFAKGASFSQTRWRWPPR
jgi:hypothetical protein